MPAFWGWPGTYEGSPIWTTATTTSLSARVYLDEYAGNVLFFERPGDSAVVFANPDSLVPHITSAVTCAP